MLPVILVISGSGLMLFGLCMLYAWADGSGRWIDAGVFSRRGTSKNERQFLDVYYIAIVLAPLLCGAVMIVFALREWF